MSEFNIAVIKGDGIGPEVVDAAIAVLEKIAVSFKHKFNYEYLLAGGAAIDEYGEPLPSFVLEKCKKSDSVLLGAVGGQKWDNVDPMLRPEKALLGLRKGLGLYTNLRPALLYPSLKSACPLKDVDSVDLIIVRELTGGIYFGKNGTVETSDGHVSAFDTEEYSDVEINRILRQGFELASNRSNKITLVDKANVLSSSRLWRKLCENMSKEYPLVAVDYLYVDNCSMQLISRPSSFDVIVTSNMFGDILSDEAGMITGSIGILPSASIGETGTPGIYEPVHGAANDIAGMDKANPIATILSAAMLLRINLGLKTEADSIENAVKRALEQGYRTSDISETVENTKLVGTKEMTKAICDLL